MLSYDGELHGDNECDEPDVVEEDDDYFVERLQMHRPDADVVLWTPSPAHVIETVMTTQRDVIHKVIPHDVM